MRRRDLVLGALAQRPSSSLPNVIIVLADDIGYGDLSCYGATRVRTPNVDALAARGLRFTDAHSSSATCTPTRYSLLTGEYAWRKKGTGILPGDAALIIDPARPNVASTMKKAGYATAAIGKWHLGLGAGKIDWNTEIKPGPRELGFDESFIIPATGDRTPCVYVQNGRVVNLDPKDPITVSYKDKVGTEPTGKEHPELLKVKLTHGHDQTIVNGVSRIGYMTGGKKALWVDEDMAKTITERAVSFISQKRQSPFLLYFATHDIHVPRVPHPDFRGKTGCGTRCEAIAEFDWSIGQLVAALKKNGQLDNTLLIITSDNGPVLDDGYADGAEKDLNGHTPAGPLRGGKYSNYEGGTRLPFIVHWPKRVKPGVSPALVSQVDLLASLASLTGTPAPAPDSQNMLPALVGESKQGRESLVEQGRGLALREGSWKYVSGSDELYDLSTDLGETKNLASAQPDRVARMKEALARISK